MGKSSNRMGFGHSVQSARKTIFGAALLMGGLTSCTWDKVQPEICFEGEVLPIFRTYCSTTGCHNPTDLASDYDFTNYKGIMEEISPGRPKNSKIYEVLTENGGDQMPPAGSSQLTSDQIAMINNWIELGADNTQNCSTASCDTAAAVTYSGDLAPMLQSNCNGCHGGGSPSGGLDFTNFNIVKQNTLSGRIQGAMSQAPAFSPMPPNSAPLSSCYIDKINKWVADGAPNN